VRSICKEEIMAKRGTSRSTPENGTTAKRHSPPRPAAGVAPANTAPPVITAEQRRELIAVSAWLRAERRGFGATSDPVQDWLEAEREVDARLAAMAGGGKS
jgi:hypothetical protein